MNGLVTILSLLTSYFTLFSSKGVLNEYRQRIVNFIFYRLDGNNSGYIEETELQHFYKHSLLPDILSRQIEPSTKARDFMRNIAGTLH